MSKIRRGGYIFISWAGDHEPRHVHVYKKGRLVLKFNLEKRVPMYGEVSQKLIKLIEGLETEGKL